MNAESPLLTIVPEGESLFLFTREPQTASRMHEELGEVLVVGPIHKGGNLFFDSEPPPEAQIVHVGLDAGELRFALGDAPAGGPALSPFALEVLDAPVTISGGGGAEPAALAFVFEAPIRWLAEPPPATGARTLVRFSGGTATVLGEPPLGLLTVPSAFGAMSVTTTALAGDPGEDILLEGPADAPGTRFHLDRDDPSAGGLGLLAPGPAPLSVTYTAMPPAYDEGPALDLAGEPSPWWRRPAVLAAAGGTAAVLVVGGVLFLGGDGDPAAEPQPEPAAPAPAAAVLPESWAQPAGLVEDAGGAVQPDESGDFIYSVPGVTPGNGAPEVDILGVRAGTLELDAGQAAALSAAPAYACGGPATCADDGSVFPQGPLHVFEVTLAGAPPADAGGLLSTYALVFDADGDPATDFVFEPPFEWDFYRGTDLWYQFERGGDEDWRLNVRRWRTDRSVLAPSAGRVVADGASLVWLLPGSEFEVVDPGWRASAFRHDGTFDPERSAGDVLGADPTQPLTHTGS